MSLRRRIDHAFDLVLLQEAVDQRLISDISMDESIACMTLQIQRVRTVAGILERVEIHDIMSALNNQTTNQVRADKAGAARDQYVHDCIPLCLTARLVIRSFHASGLL